MATVGVMVGVAVTSGVGNSAASVGAASVGTLSVVAVAGTAVGGSSVAVSVGGMVWETAVFVGSGTDVGEPPQAANPGKIKLKHTNNNHLFFTRIFLYNNLRNMLATTNCKTQAHIIAESQPRQNSPVTDLGNHS